jgi:1-hydroxycarotenoid 3,4-desaturase
MEGIGDPHIAIIGAGAGGLATAIRLAAAGLRVTVLEAGATPGGKMRQVMAGPGPGAPVDAGPTVFTMRWVFDELFAAAGETFTGRVQLHPLHTLARHAWKPGENLDLFADKTETADAIGRFAGAANARGYLGFSSRAQRIYDSLEKPFLRAQQPGSPLELVRRAGVAEMLGIAAFATLWRELGKYFPDARLRQLFARYSTYCGSSPFLAPATLMLIAHVERSGVWRVEGGMHGLAQALAALAARLGVTLRYAAPVAAITTRNGHAIGVRLRDGEVVAADAVVMAADAAALSAGLMGQEVRHAFAPTPERSLSAVTWVQQARVEGFPLHHHTVFFGGVYRNEFDDVFSRHRLPADPTVYICAQDRDADGTPMHTPERLLLLVNAPPTGDTSPPTDQEIAQCARTMTAKFAAHGLHLHPAAAPVATGPRECAALFPATGGALYGPAVHGTQASFRRPAARTRVAGLYLAGGSAHPGAGVPMAALSGQLAASALLEDLPSIRRFHKAATPGGISTRSATTGSTA